MPDTGYDPSKAAIIPSGARKRATRDITVATSGETSIKQQNVIARELAELDKDNHHDVQIIVPGRPQNVAARSLRDHMTPGVKKILQSQKTFANHLADEEAALANRSSDSRDKGHASLQRQASSKGNKLSTPRSKRNSTSLLRAQSSHDAMDIDSTGSLDATNDSQDPVPLAVAVTDEDYDDSWALIKSRVPTAPTKQEIDALLSAPPLLYVAARASPSKSSAPARQFCKMCGYWGLSRCIKCSVRICGLECKSAHEETNCQKFYG